MSAEVEETTATGNQPTATPLQSAPLNQPSDQLIASIALAGSAAIRRIIAERNELRRERERLTGANEELRRENEKTTAHRDHYRQIANELLVQLRQMHEAITRFDKNPGALCRVGKSRSCFDGPALLSDWCEGQVTVEWHRIESA